MALIFEPIGEANEVIGFKDGLALYEIRKSVDNEYFRHVSFRIAHDKHQSRQKIIVEFDDNTEERQYNIAFYEGNLLEHQSFLEDIEEYVLKPLSSQLVNDIVLVSVIGMTNGTNCAFFVASGAYAIDKHWPFGQLYADAREKNFSEIHFLSENYRSLFKQARIYYRHLSEKIVNNINFLEEEIR